MARNVTVTFADGTQHVYNNVPDDATPDQVTSRASQEFGQDITNIDGGKKPKEEKKQSLVQEFANTAPLANQAESVAGRALDIPGMLGKVIPGAETLFPDSMRKTGKEMAARGDAARAKEYEEAGKSLEQLVTKPVETVSQFAKNLYEQPGETLGNIAKGIAFDPLRNLVPVAPQISAGGKAVKGAVGDVASSVKEAAKDVRKGVEVGRIGEYEGMPSAYVKPDAELLQSLDPRTRQLIEHQGGRIQQEGKGFQALGEDLVGAVKGTLTDPVSIGINAIPALFTGGSSLPVTLAGTHLIKPAVKTLMDRALGHNVRAMSPDMIKQGPNVTMKAPQVIEPTAIEKNKVRSVEELQQEIGQGAPVVNKPVAPLSPIEVKQAEVKAKVAEETAPIIKAAEEEAKRKQIEQLSQTLPQVRNKTPDELVNDNPKIQAIKASAQEKLRAITPEELAIESTINGNPKATANVAVEKAKQMLSADMRAKIEARVAQQKADKDAQLQSALSAPQTEVPRPTGPIAPQQTIQDKLAALKAQTPEQLQGPQGLFEGMPMYSEKDVARHQAQQNAVAPKTERVTGVHQFDLERASKKMTEAKTEYERKVAEAEYNRLSEEMAKTGGGRKDVMGMMTEGPVTPKELPAAQLPEHTAELTMEVMRGRSPMKMEGNKPGEKATLESVKKTMNIMTGNTMKWEQVSPTHLRGMFGNKEYNLINSNGDIYQTQRIIEQ